LGDTGLGGGGSVPREFRSTGADGELPVSAAELAKLAGQLYAAPTGPSFPPTGPSFPSTGPSFPPTGPSFPPTGPSFPPTGPSIPSTGPTTPSTAGSATEEISATPQFYFTSETAQPYYFIDEQPVVDEDVPTTVDIDHPAVPTTATTGDQPLDVAAVRQDFPILSETVNGRPLVWFDNAATTQKPKAVIDRISYFYEHENSNIHRAAHELAARATDAYEDARETTRKFINAPRADDVIFVRGTTEAINLVAQSWGAKHLGEGDEIVITHLEHHANIVPWQLISQRTGAVIRVAPVDDRGNLLLDELERLVGPRTKIVAATHVSNALGTVTPAKEIVEIGHRYGARVLIDGAQSIPHMPIDVVDLGADFFVFSGHKIVGPTGIGVLYGTEDALADTPPWQGGGNMIADVTLERALYQGPPNKFEAGTGNIADAVGLGTALRYVADLGIERIAAYEHFLLEYATPRLAAIPGVRIIGTADEKASVLSFVLDGHEPLEVGKALNAEGIAVRAGHHCAQPILRRFGVEQTVRPSFAFYNTTDEIDAFIDVVDRLARGGV